MQIGWQLSIFQRKILQKIFRLNKQADGFWRINTNEELDKLTERKKYCKRDYIKKNQIVGAFRKPGGKSVNYENYGMETHTS